MKIRSPLILISVAIILAAVVAFLVPYYLFHETAHEPTTATFLVKPYLQLGGLSTNSDDRLELLWQADDLPATWSAEVRLDKESPWKQQESPKVQHLNLPGLKARQLCSAVLSGLVPGERFEYRLLKDGTPVFQAGAHARKTNQQPYRFVVFGDLAAGGESQKKIAFQSYSLAPDMVLLVGDIVYMYGTFIEYLNKYFPVYNADVSSPSTGAPFLRSTPFIAAPGNHDIGSTGIVSVRNLDRFPDGLAYFTLWSQPLNGPLASSEKIDIPALLGSAIRQQAFTSIAGSRYPRMSNFSFDYGNSHWLALDGNDYVDWTKPDLRNWVANDLATHQSATWRFVAFHQAPFTSGRAHFTEQRMRLLCDILQSNQVDIVFSGHIHNYQRTLPLSFSRSKQLNDQPINLNGTVAGSFKFDRTFDGQTHTKPQGVTYIITGAGGAGLNDLIQSRNPKTWQPYTSKFIANTHSFSVCDIKDRQLDFQQISEDGLVLDHFRITK